jgi:hypothetical protein
MVIQKQNVLIRPKANRGAFLPWLPCTMSFSLSLSLSLSLFRQRGTIGSEWIFTPRKGVSSTQFQFLQFHKTDGLVRIFCCLFTTAPPSHRPNVNLNVIELVVVGWFRDNRRGEEEGNVSLADQRMTQWFRDRVHLRLGGPLPLPCS